MEGFSALNRSQVQSVGSVIGGATRAGLEFGLTGRTSLNVLSLRDLAGGTPNDLDGGGLGMLELHLGGDAALFQAGMNGVDLSATALGRAAAGLGTWTQNMRMAAYDFIGGAEYTEEYAGWRSAATALRSQYSFGDDAALRQLGNLLSGQDSLQVGRADGTAETTAGAGGRVISLESLGRRWGDADDRLAAGVALQHEAYRDGGNGGAAGQAAETLRAVTAHTEMALRVNQEYVGFIAGDATLAKDLQALLKARAGGDTESFERYVEDNYDSSKDYWKLKLDGTLEWDGSRDLNIEYLDVNGRKKVRKHIADDTGSYSRSLVEYIGEDRARELLKRSGQAAAFNGAAFQALPETERKARLGKLLMQTAGMAWSREGWVDGGSNVRYSLTDRKDLGQLVINRNDDGSYERFAVNAFLFRDPRSWDSNFDNRIANSTNKKGLDTLLYEKRDLKGGVIASTLYTGIQSVDVYKRDDAAGIDRDQPYFIFGKGLRQGNTLVGDFNMTYFPPETKGLPSGEYYADAGNFLITKGTTISGLHIGATGNSNPAQAGGRWWEHWAPRQNSDGCIIPTQVSHRQMMQQFNTWRIPMGYSVKSNIYESTFRRTPFVYQ